MSQAIINFLAKLSNSNRDAVNVAINGSLPNKNIKVVQTTIINAASVPASSATANTALGTDGTESEVWVAINIDKQPWGENTANFLGNYGAISAYPYAWNTATAYANSQLPYMLLILGVDPTSQGLTAPATLSAAKDYIIPFAGAGIKVFNQHATDIATVTVRVIRIWR